MASEQPYLHNLSGVFSAPIQAWSDAHGQIRHAGAQGIYCGDDRVINTAVLTVDGREPEWVSTQLRSSTESDYIYFVRADAEVADPLLSLVRTRTAASSRLRAGDTTATLTGCSGTVAETLRLESAMLQPVTLNVRLTLGADNTTMEQVKQGGRGHTAVEPQAPTWSWRDTDTTLILTAENGTVSMRGSKVTIDWAVEVKPGVPVQLGWAVDLTDADSPMLAADGEPIVAPASDDPRLDRLMERSVSDLNSLRLAHYSHPHDTFLAAGAPWFFTMFGRDSIIAARMLLPINTAIAGGTLRALAGRQGTETDHTTAVQPGKILHEVRRTVLTMAESGQALRLPPVYYGTVDATPLWICLLHDAWKAGMPDAEVEELLPNLLDALEWLRDHGDLDGDGFLEYLDESGTGLVNQGWKDSGDAIRWHDGSLAKGPIALAEVQAYAYEAAMVGAEILEAFGRPGAAEWRDYAAGMAERFRAQFWCEDELGPYPALALDADKRPVDGVTSNMGHLLGTGILNEEEQLTVVRRVMDTTMFSGYGVRTLSTTNGGYWPTRYHAGAVWSHDTALIISGMLADGFPDEAAQLAAGLLEVAEANDWRLPELFGGHGSDAMRTPVPFPASCRPQAWASASSVVIAAALTPVGPAQEKLLQSSGTSAGR
ncbi:glycogen debranching N-terminal domain-containing protein [Arthrobacter sp. ISL-69]|uniref:glycogen debranching N-terminal domain-containing protein n=1 Tax=Arthrobacter sp. ISL-69 TaxID=2819113 RepID=UPI001BE84457|nr:glycogen debranching N-terminal domain-containing protein [Arthrobacter sp. ISL-69]MBT2534945.1 amylo-alpha-1,6-glucosidase [Arthrobacter sp. ISL-69]